MSTINVEVLPNLPGHSGGGALGRHVEHDERSRAFAIEEAPPKAAKAVLWHRWSPILDQLDLGSCTGNALAGWLGCEPYSTNAETASRFDETFAVQLYRAATRLDRIDGHYPPDDTGSTGNAVAKAARQAGLISRWSWAFTTAGLIRALQDGPVIVGVPWLSGFDRPDRAGYIRMSGSQRGGHEFLVRGYDPAGEVFTADNSWGRRYALDGSFRFTAATWEKLARMLADVTVPHR